MKSAVFLIFFLLIAIVSTSQSVAGNEKFYHYKNELGINFTNVLGNVLSLNPNNANSPYSITYRRHGKNIIFRSAFNFLFEKSDEFDFSFNQKILTVNNAQLSLGIQKTLPLSHGFALGYGVDVLGAYEYEFSEVRSFNGASFEAIDRIWRIGAGPMLRLEYKLSQRVFFSTESSFYSVYGRRSSQISEFGLPLSENKSSQWDVRLLLPQSLFINIAF